METHSSSLSICCSCRFSQSISSVSPCRRLIHLNTSSRWTRTSVSPRAGADGERRRRGQKKRDYSLLLLSPDSTYVLLQCSYCKRMGGFDTYNELSMNWLCANAIKCHLFMGGRLSTSDIIYSLNY